MHDNVHWNTGIQSINISVEKMSRDILLFICSKNHGDIIQIFNTTVQTMKTHLKKHKMTCPGYFYCWKHPA